MTQNHPFTHSTAQSPKRLEQVAVACRKMNYAKATEEWTLQKSNAARDHRQLDDGNESLFAFTFAGPESGLACLCYPNSDARPMTRSSPT